MAADHNITSIFSTIIIIHTDNLSDVVIDSLLAFHRSHGDPMTMMLFKALYAEDFGIPTLDPSNRIVSLGENPKHSQGDLANAVLYIVSHQAHRNSADIEAFDWEFDVLPHFLRNGGEMSSTGHRGCIS